MFIKVNKKGNKKYGMLVEGYRDKDGKVKHKIIKYFGLLKKNQIKNPKLLLKTPLELKHS